MIDHSGHGDLGDFLVLHGRNLHLKRRVVHGFLHQSLLLLRLLLLLVRRILLHGSGEHSLSARGACRTRNLGLGRQEHLLLGLFDLRRFFLLLRHLLAVLADEALGLDALSGRLVTELSDNGGLNLGLRLIGRVQDRGDGCLVSVGAD